MAVHVDFAPVGGQPGGDLLEVLGLPEHPRGRAKLHALAVHRDHAIPVVFRLAVGVVRAIREAGVHPEQVDAPEARHEAGGERLEPNRGSRRRS